MSVETFLYSCLVCKPRLMTLGVHGTSFHGLAAGSVAWSDVPSLPTKQLSPPHFPGWGWEEDVGNKLLPFFVLA